MGMGGHEKPIKGETDIWLTPPWIIERLGQFDLDPCGRDNYRTAKKVISLPTCGLATPWDPDDRVWLNPPYSNVEQWLKKLSVHGRGVALVFARVETKWAQKIIPQADSVFFPAGRLRFLRADFSQPSGNAGAPSMFLSFGEKPNWHAVMPGWVAK